MGIIIRSFESSVLNDKSSFKEKIMDIKNFGYNKQLNNVNSIEEARTKVESALKNNGFGVITEIDVKNTMKKKLGKDYSPYIILGACNPEMAYKALGVDEYLGLMLPCNVIVFEKDGKFNVSFTKPSEMFKLIDKKEMEPIADKVDRLIKAAYEAL